MRLLSDVKNTQEEKKNKCQVFTPSVSSTHRHTNTLANILERLFVLPHAIRSWDFGIAQLVLKDLLGLMKERRRFTPPKKTRRRIRHQTTLNDTKKKGARCLFFFLLLGFLFDYTTTTQLPKRIDDAFSFLFLSLPVVLLQSRPTIILISDHQHGRYGHDHTHPDFHSCHHANQQSSSIG